MDPEKKVLLTLTLNGKKRQDWISPDMTLLNYLREECDLFGTKEACGAGECGACTVILDGRAVYSCITLAVQAEGKSVETIEGLGQGDKLHPIQKAFMEAGAVQCGFCTPGFIMTTKALLDRNHHPSEEEIRIELAGNLCRCTGYVQIIDAVKLAAEKMYGKAES